MVQPVGALSLSTTYKLTITDQLQGANGAAFTTREVNFKTVPGSLQLVATRVNNEAVSAARVTDVPVTALQVEFDFSVPLDPYHGNEHNIQSYRPPQRFRVLFSC
jgi:hypothetical protein